MVSALQSNGIEFRDLGEFIGVVQKPSQAESDYRRISALLEELSVLNGALSYHEVSYGAEDGLSTIKCGLESAYWQLLKKRKLPDAYHLVSFEITEFVTEIASALHALSARDKKTLESLLDFARTQARQLNYPKGVLFS